MAKRAMGWVLVLLTVSLVGCDHATKLVAREALAHGRTVALVPGMLDLRYRENDDTAFSMIRWLHFAPSSILLAALALVGMAAVAILWASRYRAASPSENVAYALLAAGAVGNVADRLLHGYVVDFIYLHHWPVFNVADVVIVAGAALLSWSFWKRQRSQIATS